MATSGDIRTSCSRCFPSFNNAHANLLHIHKVAHAQSDLLGGGHGGGELCAGQPAPALCQGNLLYIHKVAHAQSDLLGGVPPGGGGHGGGELCAGQLAPALSQGVQVRRHVRQLHQLQHIHNISKY
jgi:hypothetical protein